MKLKIMLLSCAAILAAVLGCKQIPTDSQLYTTSYACGTAAACVCNMTKIDDTSRAAVVDIMNKVDSCIPATNETFAVAWTPIAKEHVAKLVEDKKIDAAQGAVILGAFRVAVNGIDYVMNIRYPKARRYQELTEAAVHGFVDGFLTVFKPANSLSAGVNMYSVPMDVAAYEYLKIYKADN